MDVKSSSNSLHCLSLVSLLVFKFSYLVISLNKPSYIIKAQANVIRSNDSGNVKARHFIVIDDRDERFKEHEGCQLVLQ